MNRIIVTIALGVGLLSGCDNGALNGALNEVAKQTDASVSTATPRRLSDVNSEILFLLVRIDDKAPDYRGEHLGNGSWRVPLQITLDTTHTFVASWYANTNSRPVLLMRQSGEFYANSASPSAEVTTPGVTFGSAEFDVDCDQESNLLEIESGENPWSSPGCDAVDGADTGGTNSDNDATPPGTEEPEDAAPPVSNLPTMVRINGDCFMMGNPVQDEFYREDQRYHEVCVEPFEMSVYETTFEQYAEFANSAGVTQNVPNDNNWGDTTRPVFDVSWRDAYAYADWLSDRTGQTYRLPTEAQWEYAARGKTTTPFWTGTELRDDQEHFNSSQTHGGGVATGQPDRDRTRPVGSLQPNQYGLYDMLGNLLEHTCSAYSATYADQLEENCNYDFSVSNVNRGGSYSRLASWSRVEHRTGVLAADSVDGATGFRVVRVLP